MSEFTIVDTITGIHVNEKGDASTSFYVSDKELKAIIIWFRENYGLETIRDLK